MRRGACPTLRQPMLTGDGLLARLPPAAMPPAAWQALGRAALRFGNGLLDVTARGSIQLRGLRPETLAEAIAAIGPGWPESALVMTSPLAGHDPLELRNPRNLAARIASNAPAGLPAKTVVLVDGGGRLHLDHETADLHLKATERGWHLSCAGLGLGEAEEARIAAAALALLNLMAGPGLRARQLASGAVASAAARLLDTVPTPRLRALPVPLGGDGLSLGIAGAFGQIEADALIAFAQAAAHHEVVALRGAPGRALLALGARQPAALLREAAKLGFIITQDDPRRRVTACTGAPGCTSGQFATRALALELAPLLPDSAQLHVSGCAKGCAHPGVAPVTLVGEAGMLGIVRQGRATDPVIQRFHPDQAVAAIVKEFNTHV